MLLSPPLVSASGTLRVPAHHILLRLLSGNNNNNKRMFSADGSTKESNQRQTTTTTSNHVQGKKYPADGWTNVTPRILSHLDANLHLRPHHPLSLVRERIVSHMYRYRTHRGGNPLFSVHDRLSPVVSLEQNFDSLLVPRDHPSRSRADSYYLNEEWMLRAHTSAHQAELIRMGLDNFLVIGDVYRRDEIDSSHYPVFHQVEGVRLLDRQALAEMWQKRQLNPTDPPADFEVFERGEEVQRSDYKQGRHTVDAAKILEIDLKECLADLARELFGKDIEYRWVDAYFPFTHPSWELEVLFEQKWMEVLGCGVIEHRLLEECGGGAAEKAGWAFGLGLERLAMRLYGIPDIRLFWCKDSGFHNQFVTNDPRAKIVYKPISRFPQCSNDVSFWLPSSTSSSSFSSNDFYDLVRTVGGDVVEQVRLVDQFDHPKTRRRSHCYRIVYRSPEKTLTQDEVNEVHRRIEEEAQRCLNVTIR